MQLVNFWESGILRLGVKREGGILDVAAALSVVPQLAVKAVPATLREVLDGGEAALGSLREFIGALPSPDEGGRAFYRDEASLEFAPCITDPGKIICTRAELPQTCRRNRNAAAGIPDTFQQIFEQPGRTRNGGPASKPGTEG
ncbi:hypothetical protein D3C76_114430 [compost metagenome]